MQGSLSGRLKYPRLLLTFQLQLVFPREGKGVIRIRPFHKFQGSFKVFVRKKEEFVVY